MVKIGSVFAEMLLLCRCLCFCFVSVLAVLVVIDDIDDLSLIQKPSFIT